MEKCILKWKDVQSNGKAYTQMEMFTLRPNMKYDPCCNIRHVVKATS